ncbi:hypothetical protein OMP38_17695 [Cohnella ginsengisoli]|uniref:Uncharacterized protein n=1 Tax=Cohnella ginsengisoli TaxID=425004 RepID=A0A9X4QNK1_9BACL|nr:hypothetical protein [Cohnella ginsengisoli]MDG0792502.1 hypothetical protein [Cohnella ginsengisoli]
MKCFFIEEKRRTPDLLLAAASELVDDIRDGERQVRHIQFWVPSLPGADAGRLLRRIASLPGASRTEAGALTLYKLPLDELERWIRMLASKRADRRKIR